MTQKRKKNRSLVFVVVIDAVVVNGTILIKHLQEDNKESKEIFFFENQLTL